MKFYSESADLGNVQAQIMLTSRQNEASQKGSIAELSETSLAKDLDQEAIELHHIAFNAKPTKGRGISHQLERLRGTASTIPTNQEIKEIGSNPCLKTGANPSSLLSENMLSGVP